jgi:cardiolipin synthase
VGSGLHGATNETADSGILTLPNIITVVRLLCLPIFLWLLFAHHHHEGRYHAALLLAAMGATDWVDGYAARHLHQVSTVGKVLDPTADRALLGVAIISILIDGSVPIWIGALVITREALVAGAAVVLALAGAKRIDVQWVGKAGTFGMMVALPLFLAAGSTAGWHHLARVLAYVAVVPALALSWYAAITYIPLARQALVEGRAVHQEAHT